MDSNRWTADLLRCIADHNHLSSRIQIVQKPLEELECADLDGQRIDVVVSDMWFQTLNLPWDGLYFAYALKSLKPFLSSAFKCLPKKGELRGICLSMQVTWWLIGGN